MPQSTGGDEGALGGARGGLRALRGGGGRAGRAGGLTGPQDEAALGWAVGGER